jgi:hypothetical protein
MAASRRHAIRVSAHNRAGSGPGPNARFARGVASGSSEGLAPGWKGDGEMTGEGTKDYSHPETITAWQCIGCGRLDAPANCVGICQDRKVELVGAWDYADVAVALEEAKERIAALETLLGRLARITPHESAWRDSYLALQAQARKLLAPPVARAAD